MEEGSIHYSDERAGRFIECLRELEITGVLDEMVGLFTEDAELGNPIGADVFHGQEGARQLWQQHRNTFGPIQSRFRNIICAADGAALEWAIDGTRDNGVAVSQEGVSIIEWRGDQICRFRAYFSARELGRQVQSTIADASPSLGPLPEDQATG